MSSKYEALSNTTMSGGNSAREGLMPNVLGTFGTEEDWNDFSKKVNAFVLHYSMSLQLG